MSADWIPSLHPRDPFGQFASLPPGGYGYNKIHTAGESGAILRYVGPDHDRINKRLRGIETSGNGAETDRWIRNLDQAALRYSLPEETTLYRGISRLGRPPGWNPQPGDRLSDPAFMSTSTVREVAQEFSDDDGDHLVITAPAGTRGIDVGAWSDRDAEVQVGLEDEWVLPRGAVLEVTRVEPRHSSEDRAMFADLQDSQVIHARLVGFS